MLVFVVDMLDLCTWDGCPTSGTNLGRYASSSS
jgi:hypothetical protein